MKITQQCVVSLTWMLKDTLGEVLDELSEPMEFLLGGTDLLASLEKALQGHVRGDTLQLQLEPPDAFGDYDENLLFLEPRQFFPADLEEGMGFEGLPAGCSSQAPTDRFYFVSSIYQDHVVMDGNHPLAGMALRIDLKVHDVRAASAQEVAQGTLGYGFLSMQIGQGLDVPDEPLPPTLH